MKTFIVLNVVKCVGFQSLPVLCVGDGSNIPDSIGICNRMELFS